MSATSVAITLCQPWGTVSVNGDLLAHICPICGAFVTKATDTRTGLSGKQAHTTFHIDLAGATP